MCMYVFPPGKKLIDYMRWLYRRTFYVQARQKILDITVGIV